MLLFLYIFCIIHFSVSYEFNELDLMLRSSAASISQSFQKLLEDIRKFFKCKYESIMHRKGISKNAFYKFLSESFNKSATKKCDEETTTRRKSGLRKTKLIPKLPKIGRNLDIEMTKQVTSHGYRVETHTILTTDGYMLRLHRILRIDSDGSEFKKVLLHHGLLGSSEDWVLLGSNKALPYLLQLSGYDVWLTNARGNKFSKTHTRLPVNSEDYWDFSFHEIGIYDLSAAIDYIKEISDSKSELHFIGYSMGGTALLVLLSTYPRYNKILNSAILLAPLAFMNNVKGPLRFLADSERYENIDYLGDKEFQANGSFHDQIFSKFCIHDYILCLKPILLIANGGKEILNQDLKHEILYYASGMGSAKTIKHYVQLVNSGQFQMFDYGPVDNLKKYGMRAPPSYRLNDVTLPIALISSTADWLSTISDIANLIPFLSNPIVHHVVKRYEFSHTDFVWAEDSPQLVYNLILDILLKPKVPEFLNEHKKSNMV